MLNKQLLIWCGALFISLALTGFLGVKSYIHQKIQSGIESGIATYILESQNQALKSKELKTKEYEKQIPKIKETIITKYQIIKEKDKECQAQLQEVRRALDLYYDSNVSN